jgi:ubiquitin C-terminal hydrolase
MSTILAAKHGLSEAQLAVKFQLFGFVELTGKHYTSKYCINGNWIAFDGAQMTSMPAADVHSSSKARLIFYERIDADGWMVK